ncbi:MAG: TIGR03936 family radical SAM-associated protein [Streptosporangiaceae bacterium]|jgi:radical SAM-linked protein
MGRQQPRPTGPAPLPAVQRLVVRYAKRGRMRFASSRDIARAVERAVRRAGLPVAQSAGFSPHPKISYSGGAPTGAASEAEFLEISLTAAADPGLVRDRLDAALPDGIDVIEVADLAAAPAPRLEASDWQVVLPGVAPEDAARAAEVFLAAAHAEVDRLTSNGVRRLDTRAGVVSLAVDRRATTDGQPECAILRMVVRHMTPAVRPEDILVAFRHMSALEPASPPVVTRLAQGPLGTEDAAAAEASVPGSGHPAYVPAAPGLVAPAGLTGAVTPQARPAAEAPRPDRRDAAQGQVMATCLEAGTASTASTAPDSAYEQLPRGAERPGEVACAREPDGRDRPNARDRARQQRIS